MTITIDPNDLAAHPYGSSKPTILIRTRMDEAELPVSVSITYANLEADYERGHEVQRRIITDSPLTINLELPLALTPNKAAQTADILLNNHWVERVSYELQLPFFKYWMIEPTDILDLTIDGTTHSIRVTDIDYDLSRIIKVKGVANDASVYTSNVKGGVTTKVPAELPVFRPAWLKLMNLPPLNPSADKDLSGFYVALSSYLFGASSTSGTSAILYVSYDGGASYTKIGSNTSPCTFGTVISAIASAPTCNTWDVGTTFTVRMNQGTPVSATDLEVLNGSNTAYVDGEILRYANVSLVASSTYRFSRLIRGVYATDASAVTHDVGEDFVILNSSVFSVSLSETYRNVELPYKMEFAGQTKESITYFTATGRALKPYSPVHVKGVRNANLDLTISWLRRDRISTEWIDYVDISMNESSLLYDVVIVDASASAVRTYGSVTSGSQVYNASAQIEDFGSTQGSITVQVFQLSGAVGRGTGRSATI